MCLLWLYYYKNNKGIKFSMSFPVEFFFLGDKMCDRYLIELKYTLRFVILGITKNAVNKNIIHLYFITRKIKIHVPSSLVNLDFM